MSNNQSFDVTTGCDLQEVDNAVNQAEKELRQRYDFRNVTFTLELKRKENEILLAAPDQHKLDALWDVLQTKLVRRQVAIKNLKREDPEAALGGSLRQKVTLTQGIPGDVSKAIAKFIKDKKLKKVQAAIQGDEVRISSPSRDTLQEVMGLLRQEDWGIELNFGNFRS